MSPSHSSMAQARPSAASLLKSTVASAAVALAILTTWVLPAEYNIDPTGIGRILGLTEMGEIKQQLTAEAIADDAAAAAAGNSLASSANSDAVLQRLDRIDGRLAALETAIATGAMAAPAPVEAAAPAPAEQASAVAEPVPVPTPAPQASPEPAPGAVAAAPEAPAASAWRDDYSVTLAPGEGIEVKLKMQEGETATFQWSANGSAVNFDMHGDGSGQKTSYEQGRGAPGQVGTLTAAFTGNHGWFWRNRTNEPVTVTLSTGGEYEALLTP